MSKLWLRGARKLTFAGIKISLIELQSCELFQELALAGIKVNGSEENAPNSIYNMNKLELRSARKLTLARITIMCIRPCRGRLVHFIRCRGRMLLEASR